MPKPLIDDELWTIVKALLPRRRTRLSVGRGRPRVSDRATLTGIVFVLRSGIPWKILPLEMSCEHVRYSALGHFDPSQSPRRNATPALGPRHPSHRGQARYSAGKAQADAS